MSNNNEGGNILEIWGRRNSINVQKVLWCCEELDLNYRLVEAGGGYGRNNGPEYLAMNPTGLVPTLVDNGTVLWESNAIVRYLAYYYGQNVLWPSRKQEHARAETWMDWQHTAWSSLRPVFIELIRTPEGKRDQEVVDTCLKNTKEHMCLLEHHLIKHNYIAGSTFSMGDIPLGVTVNRWLKLVKEHTPMTHLEAWEKRLCKRPPYVKTVATLPLS